MFFEFLNFSEEFPEIPIDNVKLTYRTNELLRLDTEMYESSLGFLSHLPKDAETSVLKYAKNSFLFQIFFFFENKKKFQLKNFFFI